ncbi:SgcJ/EcaC family oxidoreductase [Actinoallomurus vinaceus]|uniref:SgcJ/EcaC family oxidoreductase n=1 Tax=Actinoallomurus vinaceus TaxID=1080074 RepID=A0ABP8UI80_9ACTN
MTMNSDSRTPVLAENDSAVREVLDGIVAAWADNDAEAFAAFYTEDATVVLPGGVHHQGREELRAYMAAGFAGPVKGSRSIDRPENIRIIDGRTAVVVSLSGFLLPGEDEIPAERMRRATWVLAEHDGQWLVEAYHNCSINA